jgi:hypothetical protein
LKSDETLDFLEASLDSGEYGRAPTRLTFCLPEGNNMLFSCESPLIELQLLGLRVQVASTGNIDVDRCSAESSLLGRKKLSRRRCLAILPSGKKSQSRPQLEIAGHCSIEGPRRKLAKDHDCECKIKQDQVRRCLSDKRNIHGRNAILGMRGGLISIQYIKT